MRIVGERLFVTGGLQIIFVALTAEKAERHPTLTLALSLTLYTTSTPYTSIPLPLTPNYALG